MQSPATARHLLEIIRVLVSETDIDATARLLLQRILALSGAARGFVVVREGNSYVDKFDVGFDRTSVSTAERRFSRALVRLAIDSREPIYSSSAADDARFPPLRQRSGDRELLVEHFLARFAKQKGVELRLTAAARAALLAHDYPGNARELEHAIERMALLATTAELGVELLPPAIQSTESPSAGFHDYSSAELRGARASAVAGVEERFIEGLLQKADGNVSAAARAAGMSRGYLQKLIARRRAR